MADPASCDQSVGDFNEARVTDCGFCGDPSRRLFAATSQILTDRASWIGAIDTKRVTIDPFNNDVLGTDNISPTNTHFITIGKA